MLPVYRNNQGGTRGAGHQKSLSTGYKVPDTQSHSRSGRPAGPPREGASIISQHVPAGLVRGLFEG